MQQYWNMNVTKPTQLSSLLKNVFLFHSIVIPEEYKGGPIWGSTMDVILPKFVHLQEYSAW